MLRSVGVTSAVQTCSLNAGLAMWNVVICQTAAYLVPKISRRVSFFTSHAGMIVCLVFITAFSATFQQDTVKNAKIGLATVPFLFIFYGFYDIGESYPLLDDP